MGSEMCIRDSLYGVCEEKIYLKSDQPNGSKNKDQFGLFNDDDDNGVR